MNLFSRIQPDQTFHITIKAVAKLLKIPPKMIVKIEKWDYVLFVHRRDIGGQFVSYRRLRNWQNAMAMKLRVCSKIKQLDRLWSAIESDRKKYKKQYTDACFNFVKRVFDERLNRLLERWGDITSEGSLVVS